MTQPAYHHIVRLPEGSSLREAEPLPGGFRALVQRLPEFMRWADEEDLTLAMLMGRRWFPPPGLAPALDEARAVRAAYLRDHMKAANLPRHLRVNTMAWIDLRSALNNHTLHEVMSRHVIPPPPEEDAKEGGSGTGNSLLLDGLATLLITDFWRNGALKPGIWAWERDWDPNHVDRRVLILAGQDPRLGQPRGEALHLQRALAADLEGWTPNTPICGPDDDAEDWPWDPSSLMTSLPRVIDALRRARWPLEVTDSSWPLPRSQAQQTTVVVWLDPTGADPEEAPSRRERMAWDRVPNLFPDGRIRGGLWLAPDRLPHYRPSTEE